MQWIDGPAAYDAKWAWLEAALESFGQGRLCDEIHCTARSEIAFEVEHVEGELRWEASFCGQHAAEFAATTHPGWRVGLPRRLDTDEVLHGPLGDREELAGQEEKDGAEPTC